MPPTLRELENEVLGLPVDARAYLAERLLASLDDEPAENAADVEQAWTAEIERRVAELRSGAVQAVPGDTVFAELRALYR